MEPVELQLARLTAMFESSQRVASDRHHESVTRLVRIEAKQDITNGRVTELEKQRAIDDAEDADEDRKPLVKRDLAVAMASLGAGYAVLKALGWL